MAGSTTVPGSTDAKQWDPSPSQGLGDWVAAVDPGDGIGDPIPQDLAFYIDGTPVPEPATVLALATGAAALVARRRKRA